MLNDEAVDKAFIGKYGSAHIAHDLTHLTKTGSVSPHGPTFHFGCG